MLHAPLVGYISVESDQACWRVLESHFPSASHVDRVEDIGPEMVQAWATLFSGTGLVLIGGGPPCQGVSALNATRIRAEKDPRSSLVTHMPRAIALVKQCFPWAPIHFLGESVSSMGDADRRAYNLCLGVLPCRVDAGDISLAQN